MKDSAEIVIIGGGIIGCSIAYHLAKAGKKDVLVLEQFQITHGATWHAAGVIGQLRPSRNVTRMLQRSVALFDEIEADTGQAVDWKKVGSLRVASSKNRMMEFKRAATTAKSFGMQMDMLTPKEAQDAVPDHVAGWRGRRGLHRLRRLCGSGEPLPGAGHGRPQARRAFPAGLSASPASSATAAASRGLETSQGEIKARDHRGRRRHVGP